MTTIVYHKGELATDSKICRHQGTSAEQFTYGEKVYTSPCGRVYLAKAGAMYDEAAMAQFALDIIRDVFLWHREGTGRRFDPTFQGYTEEFILVTRDVTYHIDGGRLSVLQGDDVLASGSGYNYAKAACIAGLTPKEAVLFTLERDSLSGGEVHCYSASRLKEFTEQPVVKPPRKPRTRK